MSPELQELVTLAIVFGVVLAAFYSRRINNKSRGCDGCSMSQCHTAAGADGKGPGGSRDPYRPHLYRPED